MATSGGNFLPFGDSLEEESGFELRGEVQPAIAINDKYHKLVKEDTQRFKKFVESKRYQINQCLSTALNCTVKTIDNKFICCLNTLQELHSTWSNWEKNYHLINTKITNLVKKLNPPFLQELCVPVQQFYCFVVLNQRSYEEGAVWFREAGKHTYENVTIGQVSATHPDDTTSTSTTTQDKQPNKTEPAGQPHIDLKDQNPEDDRQRKNENEKGLKASHVVACGDHKSTYVTELTVVLTEHTHQPDKHHTRAEKTTGEAPAASDYCDTRAQQAHHSENQHTRTDETPGENCINTQAPAASVYCDTRAQQPHHSENQHYRTDETPGEAPAASDYCDTRAQQAHHSENQHYRTDETPAEAPAASDYCDTRAQQAHHSENQHSRTDETPGENCINTQAPAASVYCDTRAQQPHHSENQHYRTDETPGEAPAASDYCDTRAQQAHHSENQHFRTDETPGEAPAASVYCDTRAQQPHHSENQHYRTDETPGEAPAASDYCDTRAQQAHHSENQHFRTDETPGENCINTQAPAASVYCDTRAQQPHHSENQHYRTDETPGEAPARSSYHDARAQQAHHSENQHYRTDETPGEAPARGSYHDTRAQQAHHSENQHYRTDETPGENCINTQAPAASDYCDTRAQQAHHSENQHTRTDETPGEVKSTLFRLWIPNRVRPIKVYVYIYYGTDEYATPQELKCLDDRLGIWQAEVKHKAGCDQFDCSYWYNIKVWGKIYGTNDLNDSRRKVQADTTMDIFQDYTNKPDDKKNGCWNYIKLLSYNLNTENAVETLQDLTKHNLLNGFQLFSTIDVKHKIFNQMAKLLEESSDIQKFFLLYIVSITFDITNIPWRDSLWLDCLRCFQSVTCVLFDDTCPNTFFLNLYKKATGVAMSPFAAVKYFYRCLSKNKLKRLLASCEKQYKDGSPTEFWECYSMLIKGMQLKDENALDMLLNIMQYMHNKEQFEIIKKLAYIQDIAEDTKILVEEHRIKCSTDLALKEIEKLDGNDRPLQNCCTLLKNITEPELQQNVLSSAQRKILNIMQNKLKWTEGEVGYLRKITTESFVFKEDSDAVELLLDHLAKYKEGLEQLFLDVLKIRQSISPPLVRCCLTWLERAFDDLKRFDKPVENRIRSMYSALDSILDIHCVYTNKELKEKLVKVIEAEMMKADLGKLLIAGCDDMLYNGKCKDIYVNSVLKKIKVLDESGIANLLAVAFPTKSSSALVIKYEHMARVTVEILTQDKASTYQDHAQRAADISTMKYILSRAEFWIKILKVSGKFREEIISNQTLRNVQEILKIFFKNMDNQMVKVGFVNEIAPDFKSQGHYSTSVINLFQVLPGCNNCEEVFKAIDKKISKLNSRIQELSKVCSWVDILCKKLSPSGNIFICDLEKVKKDVDYINKMKQCSSVTRFEQSIEGLHLSRMNDLTLLDKAVRLDSFKKFTGIFFKKENHEEDHEIVLMTFTDFVNKVTNNVLPNYIEKMKEISSKSQLAVSEIIEYFADIKLKEEIQHLKELSGIAMHDTFSTILRYINDDKLMKEKYKCLTRLSDVFGSCLSEDTSQIAHVVKSMSNITKSSTVSEWYLCCSSLEKITANAGEQMLEIIAKLSNCQVLVEFLRKVKDEDLRHLIDVVEEHSEQFVDECTISYVIKLKSLLNRMLHKSGYRSLDDILTDIQKCFVGDLKGVPQMLDNCSCHANSIRLLYLNVENRGEVTKIVVVNLLKDGIVTFKFDNETVTTEVTYSEKKIYGLDDLADLKSRVLLIANTEKQDGNGKKHAELKEFVKFTNLLTDINMLLKELQLSGHFNFQCDQLENKATNTKDRILELTELLAELRKTKTTWVEALNEMRRRFFYLNYLHSSQLHVMYEYFCSGTRAEEAFEILKFINPNLCKLPVRKTGIKFEKSDTFRIQLEKMAKSLHLALEEVQSVEHQPFYKNLDFDQIENIKAKVKSGRVYVAHIDVKNLQAIPVLLAMYLNNTRAYPLANEVLFCNKQTSWEEIELLINRCTSRERDLYCIAGVEELDHENQLRLVQYLHGLESSYDDFMLAILCKAFEHDFFISSMSGHVHRAVSLSNDAVETCLRRICPEVYMITSDIAGQGKTDHVHKIAAENETSAKTISINGRLTRPELINKIRSMIIKKYHTLHLDIGENNQAVLLDNFIFELAVLKCVTSGTKCVHLNTKYIAIEVANTLDDSLRNSLQIASCFNSAENLSWNVNDFVVSKESDSAMQVVGHYLQALDTGEINKQDVCLKKKPLTEELCHSLLFKHLSSQEDMSCTILHVFLEILANQLRRFTACHYFRISSLTAMLENQDAVHKIRVDMVKTMIEISKEFTFRSVKTPEGARNIETRNVSSTSTSLMLSRVEGMIKWSDSNHLLVLFHGQDNQTLNVLYRQRSQVPEHVRKLFETQIRKQLPDYEKLSQGSLLSLIRKMSNSKDDRFKEKLGMLYDSYALTPDNILKMMLIILRVRTGIPVLLMGETGCGKTTLIKYLSAAYGVPLNVFQCHAGITEDVIKDTILTENKKTKADQLERWLFLDEINTCNHLGLINEIICSKTCGGEKLDQNLIILSACNPYIKREKAQMYTTGLKEKVRDDEFSGLVYRVHPLPESMLDYVWDYGQITEKDELAYIGKMIVKIVPHGMFTDVVNVLSFSQSFIQKRESSASVSLRDIHRFRLLIPWFNDHFFQIKEPTAAMDKNTRMRRAILLSLSLCYGVRLSDAEQRNEYWAEVGKRLDFVRNTQDVINEEQMGILNRMKLPDGIAKNSALRENVFVLFVCIFNKMPVFIVGKPGCSKSLSMQLLCNNFRGADSHDDFFRKFQQLFVVSYQGSESSTSDGILKVFEKAEKYKKHNTDANVLPVVLIDEVGLAEESHSNPLKVLHSLLEPAPGELPQVAVVGISNWALDPAKMNRAIHLSKPDLTVDELVQTAEAIGRGLKTKFEKRNIVLKPLAKAYYEFVKQQTVENFHGLRDYYAFIKYVCLHLPYSDDALRLDNQVIQKGILRNFNGLLTIKQGLLDHISMHSDVMYVEKGTFLSTEELIQENISDKTSRHLMVITSGDYSLGIITNILEKHNKGFQVIIGSQFKEDQTEGYSYRILNRIILCMEQGLVLILKDLESIYGSLYDMLNQNYTYYSMKKNCRIALGGHSNPMCFVHDDFRCLVVIDSDKVDYADPPFLNRFEKQVISFRDLLTDEGNDCISQIQQWIKDFSTVTGKQFCIQDAFLGYQEDSVPSLVYKFHRKNPEFPWHEIVSSVKKTLLLTCPPDAILRVSVSRMAESDPTNIESIQDEYFKMIPSKGLKQYINHILRITRSTVVENQKLVVLTRSSDLQLHIPEIDFQLEFLATFKSEKHISGQLKSFFNSKNRLLIIQCRPTVDRQNMVLLKFLIENYRNSFIQSHGQNEVKHVMILVNVSKGDKKYKGWQFDYTNDWQIVTLDDLEQSKFNMKDDILGKSPHDLITADFLCIRTTIIQMLNLCFSHLKFNDGKGSAKRAFNTLNAILNCSKLLELIETVVISDIQKKYSDIRHSKYHKDNWQVQLATSVEQILHDCTFSELLKSHLEKLIRDILVTVLWILEETSCWASYVALQTNEIGLQNMWESVFNGFKTRYLDNIHEQEMLEVSSPPLQLLFPFSLGFMKELEEVMKLFLRNEEVEDIESLKEIGDGDRLFLIDKYTVMVEQRYMEYYRDLDLSEEWAYKLIEDIHNIQSYHPDIDINEAYRKGLCINYMQSKIPSVRECCPFTRLTLVLLTWSMQKVKIRQLLQLMSICETKTQDHILERLYEINKTEHEGDDLIYCENYIVQAICSQLTATDVNIERLGGVESWLTETNRMLTYASKVAFDPPELHLLRFCVDMYIILVTQNHLKANLLILFCNSCDTSPETISVGSEVATKLDSPKGFTYIADLINNLLHGEKVSNLMLQRLSCLLYARCIDSNPASPRMSDIITQMCEQSLPERLLTFCGPVLHRILLNLNIKFNGFHSFPEIIEKHALNSILQKINIQDLHPLLTLTLDIAEKYFLCVAKGEENFKDFEAASQKISSAKQMSLHYVVAVAYCHIYLQWFASSLHDRQFKPSTSLIQRISSELKSFTNGGNAGGLLLYLVRLFHKSSVKDLWDELTTVEKELSCIKSIEWPKEEMLLGIGFNGMCLNDGYSEAKELIKDGKMLDLVTNVGKQCCPLEGAVAAIAEKYFWVEILRVLNDTEKMQNKLIQEIDTLPECVKIVLNGIVGHKSFKHKSLKLTIQSTYSEALQTSFLLHLLTVLTQQLISNGTKTGLWLDVVKDIFRGKELLRELDTSDKIPFKKDNKVLVINCSCGVMSLMLERMEAKHNCPICKSEDIKCTENDHSDKKNEETVFSDIASSEDIKCTENDHYDKKNEETVFSNIASLFIAGCSLVKYVLHMASDAEQADQSHTEFQRYWEKLQTTLDVSEKELTLFLHAMMNRILDLQSIGAIIVLLKDSMVNVKEESCEFKMKVMEKMKVVEGISAALEYSNRDTLYNPIISRLTKLPSLTGLRLYIKLTNECRKDYHFLKMVMEKEKELELLNSLPSLLKWYRAVHKCTHHKISRRDSEVQTVNDFILVASGKGKLKELFEIFKCQWEILRKSETLNLMLTDKKKLPEISNHSYLSDCIIEDNEHSLYVVMELLCRIQNGFLKKASGLAIDRYTAVMFLLKDYFVSLPCHPLYQTDLSNVVEFKWDEDFLLHSQNSTEYGKSHIVEYDLPRVERELADNLLFGKGFIVMDDRFPMTIYSKETFNRNSHILKDIKEQVKQEELPYHIQQSFKDISKNCGYQACKNLLNQLELILFYLQESKQKTSISVKSFQQKWGISNIQHHPQIHQNFEEEVALCHIVELYELIEQEIASGLVESLGNHFDNELSPTLTKTVHEFTEETSPDSLLVVIQCFVVRYLSQNEKEFNPQDSLVYHLNKHKEILPDTVTDKQEWLKQFPKAVQLCHVKHLHTHLMKECENAPAQPVISKPALETNPTKKKKRFGKT